MKKLLIIIFLLLSYSYVFAQSLGQSGLISEKSAETCSSSSLGTAGGSVTATLTGATGKYTYLSSLEMSCSVATAAGTGTGTVTGINGGTVNLSIDEETAFGFYWARTYTPPLPSSTTNTNIVATIPAITSGGKCVVSICGIIR